jgi:hypothetical protein
MVGCKWFITTSESDCRHGSLVFGYPMRTTVLRGVMDRLRRCYSSETWEDSPVGAI